MKNCSTINRALAAKKKIFSLFVAMMAVVSLSAKTVYLNPGNSTWAEADAITFIHAWGGTESVTNVQMVPVKEGSAILSADAKDNTSIVFVRMAPGSEAINWDENNGYWNKTTDQTITEGEDMFTVLGFSGKIANGSWSKYEEEEEKVVLPEVKLAGTMTEWATNAKTMTPAEDSLTASVTVELGDGSFEFKIVSDGNYLSLNGEGESLYEIKRAYNHADHVNLINSGRNFKLTADASGSYTFTWSYADSTLVVTFPDKVSIVGSFNSWNEAEGLMIPAENKETATKIIHLSANTSYEMKVKLNDIHYTKFGEDDEHPFTVSRSWQKADDVNVIYDGHNMKLVADIEGDYIFTYRFADSTLLVTYPTLPKVAIVGNFAGDDSWWVPVTENTLTALEDSVSASVSFNITKGDYEMKVWVGGTYLTKYGDGGKPYAIHRTWVNIPSVDVVDSKNNMKFEADVTGDYTFTWIYATKNLVVTFPSTTPTDVVNAGAENKAVKRIVNGQLVIEREGKFFNALGAEVK